MRVLTLGALVLGCLAAAVPPAGATTTGTAATSSTAAGVSGTTTAAAAGHGHGAHADSVRYASLKRCVVKKEEMPCGPWQLTLHSGGKRALTDARVFPRNARGKVTKDVPAPIAVSGDGRYIAYVRERDDRLVVRELTGKVHVMPADTLPKGTDMAGVTLSLSLTGARLAVVDGAGQKFIRLFDVAAGELLGSIPGDRGFKGFSGDEDEVLTTLGTDENTTQIITYDLTGDEVARQVPPQIAAQGTPAALHADGRSVAFYSQGTHTLKVYDLASDTVVNSVRVRFPGGEAPEMVDWTGTREVTAHVFHGDGGSGTMTVLRVDVGSGAVKVRDSYRIKNTFTFAACGG
ncbi:hypothetical protein [Sphaerisporangium perillae]|uniref:hypothetical protein n=1 Tax=Sphaerisporangium perillae TaxID=2935860 RepID=UPI00200E40CB|nr:hypothetical protein [Sphaerisporangium perillae]